MRGATTNSAPAISGQDEDLGQQTGSFAEKYTVTDVEGDNVVVTEFIDDKKIRSYQATLGQEETIELSRENWLTSRTGRTSSASRPWTATSRRA